MTIQKLVDYQTQPKLLQYSTTVKYAHSNLIYQATDFPKPKDFLHYMDFQEAHAQRRSKILQLHPEIKQLFGSDHRSLYICIFIVLAQITMCKYAKDMSSLTFWISVYFVSAVLNHMSFVLIHDLTHYSCFSSLTLNKLLAIFVNLPSGVPSAISFGRFHADHHKYLSQENKDCDIPNSLEIKLLRGPLGKFTWCALMSFIYSIRPWLKDCRAPFFMEYMNALAVFVFDYVIYKIFGGWALAYLLLGTYFCMSLHPLAMHYIAEHTEFVQGQDTYDYIGPINYINFNLGYHMEHHDFPMIPWTRLKKVREIAPEFYVHHPYHSSYIKIWIEFIFNQNMGTFSRISRVGDRKDLK